MDESQEPVTKKNHTAHDQRALQPIAAKISMHYACTPIYSYYSKEREKA